MLTLLTATGCRPDAWAICEHLMRGQDYAGPVRWVIVDDGKDAQPITFKREGWEFVVVRPAPYWSAGQNTQARNLLAGLAVIGADERVVIIEDDDYYSPRYLSDAADWLKTHELAGECLARYYHIGTGKHRQLENTQHASLCSTVMRGKALEFFRQCCKRADKFIDLSLWRGYTGRKMLHKTRHCVGLKGLPGREGIGMGHRAEFAGHVDGGTVFRQWLGDDARLYHTIQESLKRS